MHTNRLANEKSPYLLQHAHNPVDWHAWGNEAFRKAREEDKPIFLSIGYSTCHWCHVMERESFENSDIADVLNRYFVPVKVDREERPDVDRVYMTFVQATTGGGGWPMSVFLTPGLKPFFGGTYFPPDNRYGRPGFKYVLERLAEAWRTDRQSILESGNSVLEQLQGAVEALAAASTPDDAALDSGFYAFRRSFDTKHGGFGGAPKFPRPSALNFLLRYYHRTGNLEALDMVFGTLNAMARGGMHDQLGGGFHRYSVDDRWFVPHFEKMLYDQAQLAVSYLEGFQVAQDKYYAGVARRTLDYVLRDMAHPEGGFYSAEDADSAIDAGRPNEKHEGAFYLWSKAEIGRVLGQPAADWFCFHFGVEDGGNVHNDPHGEFAGRNILFEGHTPEETARQFRADAHAVAESLEQSRRKLLEARAARPRPHLDDKILTGWNGLMISAFAKGAFVLGDERYLGAARKAAEFVRRVLYRDGALLRRFRDGEAAIEGFLDDYAFFAKGLLDLYEADFDVRDLDLALELTGRMRERFEDQARGGFFSTAANTPDLVMRIKEEYDGAEPSGNSIAALNLLRLARITGRDDLREAGERTLAASAAIISQGPEAVPQMLVALAYNRSAGREIVLAGGKQDAKTREFLDALGHEFLPFTELLLAEPGLGRLVPEAARMHKVDGATAAYVCENFSCKMPTTDVRQLIDSLRRSSASGG